MHIAGTALKALRVYICYFILYEITSYAQLWHVTLSAFGTTECLDLIENQQEIEYPVSHYGSITQPAVFNHVSFPIYNRHLVAHQRYILYWNATG